MTLQHALMFLGFYAIGVLACFLTAMLVMNAMFRRRAERERAIPRLAKRLPAPQTPLPVSTYFRQGKINLDQAEAAALMQEERVRG